MISIEKLRTLLRWSFFAALFAIPFGTSKFLFSFETPFTNFYTSEYTSAFLFGTDLLFLALFGAAGFFYLATNVRSDPPPRLSRATTICFGIFLLGTLASVWLADERAFAAYSFVRLLFAAAVGYAVWWVHARGHVLWKETAGVIALSATVQAIIAFLQFVLQKSIGLRYLGETVALGPATPGVAGIMVEGERFLRAYGTMPHANILAGFLMLGLVALCYLLLRNEKWWTRMLAVGGIVIVETGLLLTFSRSGWIVAAFALVATLGVALFHREHRRRAYGLTFTLIISLMFLVSALEFFVVPRAHLAASEGPVRDRVVYNRIGIAIMSSSPLGVGIGNELYYAYERGMFDAYDLPAQGQWQPIHNLYLLLGSEIGVVGLLAFLGVLLVAVMRTLKRKDIEVHVGVIMLASLLIFGLFDHFLWDLQAGRLMLWVVLGILLGVSARMDGAIRERRSTV